MTEALRDDRGEPFDIFYVKEKDPNYYYRWCNTKDRNMSQVQFEGFEIAPADAVSFVPVPAGQATPTPGGSVARYAGDLVLMRIPREKHEKTIKARERAVREQQATTIDTMIDQANEQARRQLKAAGASNVPAHLVFKDEPTDSQ